MNEKKECVVILNGKPRSMAEALSLDEMVTSLGLESRSVLVEHNGVAVAGPHRKDVLVVSGDRIEIFRVVAGG
ncbi:MAG: sulfur carrier protein ThiS [Candidatus Methylacidiphilales bacterium]